MERAEQAMVERVINHEMRERFTAGAVRRAVLLQHGDDPAIEPGQLMVRVFVEASDEPGLTAWQGAHQEGIDNFRRELSLRLPAARLLEFTIDSPGDQPGAPAISVPDDGSLAAEQLSGREIVTKALELLRANDVFPEQAGQAAAAIEARLEAGEYDDLDNGVTCSPSGLTGQQAATGQVRQPGFTRASKTGLAMPAVTVSTRSLAQPGSSSSASGPCRCTLARSVTPAALPTWTSSAPPGSARPNRSNAPSSTASW